MKCHTERKICHDLIDRIIAKGYIVSVYEGGDYAIKRSRDAEAIKASLNSTDHDTIIFRNPDATPLHKPVGSILLVYGNGEDVISDYTDNAETRALVGDA